MPLDIAYMSLRDASVMLRVSEGTVRKYMIKGIIKHHILPTGTRRILRNSVEEVAKQIYETSTTQSNP